jgi:hypothetical protein
MLIRGGSACLFLRQTGGRDAMFLPEVVIFEFDEPIQYFNWESTSIFFAP